MHDPNAAVLAEQQNSASVAPPPTPKPSVVITQPATSNLAAEFLQPSPPDLHLTGAALKAYDTHTRKDRQDKLIVEYIPMVHKIVSNVATYVKPPLSREDLVSAGTIGLVKAARDFDSSRDAEFKTYAYIRVRGAVIDELRGFSFTPVNIKKQFANAQKVLEQMTESLGHQPDDKQLAEKLGITVNRMYKIFETARTRHFLSIHGLSEESPALGDTLASNSAGPSSRIERAELQQKLTEAITNLPEKQRQIVIMYYARQLTMKEIAMVLKLTESRISQLHAAALFKLSVKLKDFNDSA
jgi:RNA polymerase sigma factor for flagellar operon FliA